MAVSVFPTEPFQGCGLAFAFVRQNEEKWFSSSLADFPNRLLLSFPSGLPEAVLAKPSRPRPGVKSAAGRAVLPLTRFFIPCLGWPSLVWEAVGLRSRPLVSLSRNPEIPAGAPSTSASALFLCPRPPCGNMPLCRLQVRRVSPRRSKPAGSFLSGTIMSPRIFFSNFPAIFFAVLTVISKKNFFV